MTTYSITISTNEYQASANPLFKGHETTAFLECDLDLDQAKRELDNIAENTTSQGDYHRFDEKNEAIYNLIEEQASELNTTVEAYTAAHPKMVGFLANNHIKWEGAGIYFYSTNDVYEALYIFGSDSFEYDGYTISIQNETI